MQMLIITAISAYSMEVAPLSSRRKFNFSLHRKTAA